jgi:hypothetical protein
MASAKPVKIAKTANPLIDLFLFISSSPFLMAGYSSPVFYFDLNSRLETIL